MPTSPNLVKTEPPPVSGASDPNWFRKILGQYPTGVCVVTSVDGAGVPIGMVVGSFTSVSLDPPLVAFLPATTSTTWPKIHKTGTFCVNVLAADQEDVCRAFASGKKFDGLSWRPGATGAPILEDAVTWIDCDIEAVHQAGDHDIVVGRVRELDLERPTLPLLFFQGGYGRFTPLSLASRDTRFGPQLRVVDRARPLMEAVARSTDAQVVAVHGDGLEQTTLASAGTPSDPQTRPQTIGQRFLVSPPIGVWWMAFARPELVDPWLAAIESPELRDTYREVLDEIRDDGCCLGLTSVRVEVDEIVSSSRGHPHEAPREEERRRISAMPLDPLNYVLSRRDDDVTVAQSRDVVSVWAPTFDAGGDVDMGMMIVGFRRDDTPLMAYATEVRRLASEVTAIASD